MGICQILGDDDDDCHDGSEGEALSQGVEILRSLFALSSPRRDWTIRTRRLSILSDCEAERSVSNQYLKRLRVPY